MPRRRLPTIAAAVALALGGCGDGEGDAPPTTAAVAPPPATTTVPVPEAQPEAAPSAEHGGARAGEPVPPGPPRIPFRRGDGRPVGGLARSAYTAQAFATLPPTFRRGPIPAGSHAGGCRVRAPSRADRRSLRRLFARRHPRDTLQGLYDENVLLARCDRGRGGHGIVVWTRIAPDRDRTTEVLELRARDGRWTRRGGRPGVGCGLPRAAASAFRIDVSRC